MLTARQKQAHDFIRAHTAATGAEPSYRVIARHLGKSIGDVYALVSRISEREAFVRAGQRVRYYRFDDEAKELVPWP